MLAIITRNLSFAMSVRQKGPKDFRDKVRRNEVTEYVEKKEDFFKPYYAETNHLYKNNFSSQELENSNEMVRRVFSLENATPREVLKYRIERATKKYQISLTDHGSAAVQCASMSERIILLMEHAKKYNKDKKSQRKLVELIQKRRNMLNYLMRTDFHRYQWVCMDYGIIEENAIQKHLHKDDFILKINPSKGL